MFHFFELHVGKPGKSIDGVDSTSGFLGNSSHTLSSRTTRFPEKRYLGDDFRDSYVI
ncbi:MAG: hypothetical protein PUG97_02355 [bacterium]|nr:hypothetical protein [bacterium]